MVHHKSGTFIVIVLLNEHLTWVHSQKDNRLHFGESFTLIEDHVIYMFVIVKRARQRNMLYETLNPQALLLVASIHCWFWYFIHICSQIK